MPDDNTNCIYFSVEKPLIKARRHYVLAIFIELIFSRDNIYTFINYKPLLNIHKLTKMKDQIHVFATWKVKKGHIETVLNLLKTVQTESLREADNLFYTIHQSASDNHTLILFEGYKNEDAINTHRNSIHFQELVLGKIVPLLETRAIMLAAPIEF